MIEVDDVDRQSWLAGGRGSWTHQGGHVRIMFQQRGDRIVLGAFVALVGVNESLVSSAFCSSLQAEQQLFLFPD